MHGLHLTADLRGCPPEHAVMTDADALRACCVDAVRQAGLAPVGELFHRFAARPAGPGGVTGVVLLAESHLAVHTWPELGVVTLDVYVCNLGLDNAPRAEVLMQALCTAFAPAVRDVQRLRRGHSTEAAP